MRGEEKMVLASLSFTMTISRTQYSAGIGDARKKQIVNGATRIIDATAIDKKKYVRIVLLELIV
jgi:hypothetical protein